MPVSSNAPRRSARNRGAGAEPSEAICALDSLLLREREKDGPAFPEEVGSEGTSASVQTPAQQRTTPPLAPLPRNNLSARATQQPATSDPLPLLRHPPPLRYRPLEHHNPCNRAINKSRHRARWPSSCARRSSAPPLRSPAGAQRLAPAMRSNGDGSADSMPDTPISSPWAWAPLASYGEMHRPAGEGGTRRPGD